MQSVIQLKGENENLKDQTKLLETENEILKDDVVNKQKLINSLLQHDNAFITSTIKTNYGITDLTQRKQLKRQVEGCNANRE